jgi:hypothetical protein
MQKCHSSMLAGNGCMIKLVKHAATMGQARSGANKRKGQREKARDRSMDSRHRLLTQMLELAL